MLLSLFVDFNKSIQKQHESIKGKKTWNQASVTKPLAHTVHYYHATVFSPTRKANNYQQNVWIKLLANSNIVTAGYSTYTKLNESHTGLHIIWRSDKNITSLRAITIAMVMDFLGHHNCNGSSHYVTCSKCKQSIFFLSATKRTIRKCVNYTLIL